MPSGLMCRSALTAAECSVRGESLSFVGEGPARKRPGCRQAGIPKPSPPRMRSCGSLWELWKTLPPRITKGTFCVVAKQRFKPGNGFLDVCERHPLHRRKVLQDPAARCFEAGTARSGFLRGLPVGHGTEGSAEEAAGHAASPAPGTCQRSAGERQGAPPKLSPEVSTLSRRSLGFWSSICKAKVGVWVDRSVAPFPLFRGQREREALQAQSPLWWLAYGGKEHSKPSVTCCTGTNHTCDIQIPAEFPFRLLFVLGGTNAAGDRLAIHPSFPSSRHPPNLQ
eukprot:364625-Chlamydomonas_euryale.AAC.9